MADGVEMLSNFVMNFITSSKDGLGGRPTSIDDKNRNFDLNSNDSVLIPDNLPANGEKLRICELAKKHYPMLSTGWDSLIILSHQTVRNVVLHSRSKLPPRNCHL